ncbi:sensor histidine kinase [Curtobacterium ammoniigenes]|uniref:sensor histidine kinase n=1 Tax=Curtobacterium ammoniigenes TaxID=395387 RepID=UPI000833BD16|nr:sensor histidine kinase [Curtobacterium ammoniigenes]
MKRNGWLHLFFVASIALTAALLPFAWTPLPSLWPEYVVLAELALSYSTVGWRGYADPRAAAVFLPILVAATGALVATAPSAASLQAIVFPVLWCQVTTVRQGIVGSLVIGAATSLGFVVALGPTPATWSQIAFIEGISVVGSVALGMWISRITALSEERRRLITELQVTQDALAEAHRAAGASSERERISRELHDTIAQDLAGIVMLAERARRELTTGASGTGLERLDLLEETARDALEESRALVAAGAAGLSAGTLGGALHRLADRFARETGCDTEVSVAPEAAEAPIDRDMQVVLLRTAQEALANVRAHAAARTVWIALESPTDATVRLRVRDDGRGFDVGAARSGFGLAGIRRRLDLAGGSFEIRSDAGAGTLLAVTLPLAGAGAAHPPLEATGVRR